jgi:5''-3'' exonuclease (including N-terminal domain of PolI)
MSTKAKLLVLIDGDIFRYRCGFAAERNYYLVELTNPNDHKEWKEFDSKKEANEYAKRVTSGVSASVRTWTRKEVQTIENCLQIVKGSLTQTLDDVAKGKVIEYRIFLSGAENFRTKLAVTKPYKGTRSEIKPTYYKEIGEYLTENWKAETTTGIEADDAIGIAAMEAKERQVDYVIVSNDKDLKQIPGLHYDWVKKEFYNVSAKEAKTAFFTQLLTGDATDNVPGIPGVGPATAEKILADCKSPDEMVDACYHQYRQYFVDRDKHQQTQQVRPHDDFATTYMLEMANLVYILKDKNQTKWIDTKDGIYWDQKYNNQVPI